MGQSEKPDVVYRFADHVARLSAFIDALDAQSLILVGHDWGVALALALLRSRPSQVRGIAMMEGHLRPLDGWDDFDDGGRELFQALRTPGVGERMVLDENFFLDTLLPAAAPMLTDAQLATYRAPYPDPRSRRPLLQWAREIPIGGEPTDTAALMTAGFDNFAASPVPKLIVHGEPGVLLTPSVVASLRRHLATLTVVDVGGPAGHFLPEDRPDQVSAALIDWIGRHDW
jgi:haloalkane dehalogenase